MATNGQSNRRASIGYTWYKWQRTNVPEGLRQVGSRQLYLMYEMVSGNGAISPLTRGDIELCESLLHRNAVKRGGPGRYVITPQGRKVFNQLRGPEYYEKRGL